MSFTCFYNITKNNLWDNLRNLYPLSEHLKIPYPLYLDSHHVMIYVEEHIIS